MDSGSDRRDRWRHVKRLAWISLGAVAMAIAGILVYADAKFDNEPPLVAGISGTAEKMDQEFNDRLAAAFPPGTPSKDVIRELAKQGFNAGWDSTEKMKFAYLEVSQLVCLVTYRLLWVVDEQGNLQQIGGQRRSACL